MRNICILSFLTLCLFCSCKKSNNTSSNLYYGEAAVLINNKMWTGQVSVTNNDAQYFSLQLIKSDSSGIEERILISNIKKAIGTYNIYSLASQVSNTTNLAYNIVQGGDMVLKGYFSMDTAKNAISILSQANDYKEIWGSFALNIYGSGTSSDTLKLTEGTFHIYPEGKPNP